MSERKERIGARFAAKADSYDAAADLQWLVAQNLAEWIAGRVTRNPTRILEIGCGTGFLSARVADLFPQAALTLTDLAPRMLERCKARLGARATYLCMDGEKPQGLAEKFDLIVSSLAFQWFVDLPSALTELTALLAPGGKLLFATLGRETFREWRDAHARLGLICGTPIYPAPAELGFVAKDELIRQPYEDGIDFIHTLKLLGAGEPAPGHVPLSPGAFRKLLTRFKDGVQMTYHILYGEIER